MSAMDELWVEKHRPRSVNEIKGQPSIVSRLRAYANKGT
ncbi:MAG: Replication factor C small subunit, partial [Euryarchaeota archaeon]|nr:Replication factor C small subunit [Euryarchaeota archaeon]